jgi:hypothetical protein
MRESSSSSTLRPDGRVALVSDTIGKPPVPPGQLAQANCGAGYPRVRAANLVWPGGKLHAAVGDGFFTFLSYVVAATTSGLVDGQNSTCVEFNVR